MEDLHTMTFFFHRGGKSTMHLEYPKEEGVGLGCASQGKFRSLKLLRLCMLLSDTTLHYFGFINFMMIINITVIIDVNLEEEENK